MSLRGSHILILGPQLMTLIEKVMEPLGAGAFIHKVHQWGQVLWVYSFTLFPVLSLCFLCADENGISHIPDPDTCCLVSPTMMDSIPQDPKPI